MTAKDKAEYIFNSHYVEISTYGQCEQEINEDAIKHAIVTVSFLEDEALFKEDIEMIKYYEEVKQELEKM